MRRARNVAKVDVITSECDRSRKKLAEEREKNAQLVKELEEAKLTQKIDLTNVTGPRRISAELRMREMIWKSD